MNPRLLCISFIISLPLLQGQPVVAPSPDRTGSPLGSDWGSYNVTNSFETGYRFTTVGGDTGLFRSVANYGNGLRVFGGRFAAHSKDGHGLLFDKMSLTTSGLGNDPYGLAIVRIEKNDVYRYNMTWRRHEYFNPSQLNGAGNTFKNTRRTVQDHDLAITPAKWAKLQLGYTRNHETGPEFTNYETYIGGLARSLLPIARDVRRDFNEYRLGTELDFLGFRLSITRRWEYYKDDSPIASLIPGQPYAAGFLLNQPFDPLKEYTYRQVASAYSRSQPMHTRTEGWFGNLNRTEKYWAINARMTYSKGDTNTIYSETSAGPTVGPAVLPIGDGRSLTAANGGYGPEVTAVNYIPGTARRPFMAGDFSFSVFPTSKLSIMNSTSVSSNRYDGTAYEIRLLSTNALINRTYYFHIGTGRVSDSLDLNYKVTKWLGLNAEYRYTSRFIDNYFIRTGTTNSRDLNSVRNHLNTGTFGFNLKPIHPMTISVDATVGRDNQPAYPTSPAHFHNIRARIDYRAKKVRAGLSYRQMYNLNAPGSAYSPSTGQLTAGVPGLDYYASHSRDISANTSFDAHRRLSFDLSYTKAHIDTMANLWAELVPAESTTVTAVSVRGYTSIYISNLHVVSLIARTSFKRGTFYAGYNISRDTGDGRNVQNLGMTNLAASYTAAWSTFPLTYQAPLARLSIKLSPRMQWNGGWEFFRYNQKFAYFGYQPYYRAHTGYTSLSFTF